MLASPCCPYAAGLQQLFSAHGSFLVSHVVLISGHSSAGSARGLKAMKEFLSFKTNSLLVFITPQPWLPEAQSQLSLFAFMLPLNTKRELGGGSLYSSLYQSSFSALSVHNLVWWHVCNVWNSSMLIILSPTGSRSNKVSAFRTTGPSLVVWCPEAVHQNSQNIQLCTFSHHWWPRFRISQVNLGTDSLEHPKSCWRVWLGVVTVSRLAGVLYEAQGGV